MVIALPNIVLLIIIYIFGASPPTPTPRFLSPSNVFIDTIIKPDSLEDVVKITRSWELPASLKKISAIDFIDDYRVACLSNEVGSIFIFNISTKEIENEIQFGPPGDYEGLALVNNDAYVSSGDGRIFEILDYMSQKPVTKEYGTHLTVRHHVEGACFDKRNNRLLIPIKGTEEGNKFYKGIYAFDLKTKTMPVNPVIRIDLKDSAFSKVKSKKLQSLIQPSDITIHPGKHDIYIVDGVKSQLLTMDETGKIKDLMVLNKLLFVQPEGMAFGPSGDLYIAIEGIKQEPGMLLLVEFTRSLN